MLLVISMEEGGDNLSALSVPLTEAVVLLSQGIGFQAGAITLTILPLLLTVLLIALIASFATRFGTDIRGFVSGLVFWELMNVFFAHSVEVTLLDQLPGVMWKSALVFIVGYAVAAIPRSKLTSTLLEKVRTHVSAPVRRTLSIGTGLGMLLTGIYLIAGLVAVLYWCFANQSAVVKLYELSGMQTGSRILTTVAVIAWLPNVMIWAVSWLFGSGFAIGDLASFTMWSGQGSALPGLPAFGILPQAVSTPWIRIALLCIPFVTGLLAGLAVMLFDRGFAVRQPPDCRIRLPCRRILYCQRLGRRIVQHAIRTFKRSLGNEASRAHRRAGDCIHSQGRSANRIGSVLGMAHHIGWYGCCFRDTLAHKACP